MYADGGWLLAAGGADLISWTDRLSSLFGNYRMQLACSVAVGAVLGVLGCFVILRRMALIGDAISHAVLPGVVVAFLLVGTGLGGLFLGALAAGVTTAVCINLLTRFSRLKEDAAVGIAFTAMFAVGIILISYLPSGTHFDMKCFLFGDPLAIQREEALAVAIIVPLVLLTVTLLFHPLKLVCFDPVIAPTLGISAPVLHYTLMILLSATIVAALSSVGVVMGVAMLITPAAVAYQLTNRLATMLVVAGLVGAASALGGMLLAFQINCPPGPAMVVTATAFFLLSMTLAPEHGLISNWLRRRRIRAHILDEDVLKALAIREESTRAGERSLAELIRGATESVIDRAVARLVAAGQVSREGGAAALTPIGRTRALQLIRAHRIWESYLAEHDVRDPLMHAEAERLEHAHSLTEDLATTLGHPEQDPHGTPIPPAIK